MGSWGRISNEDKLPLFLGDGWLESFLLELCYTSLFYFPRKETEQSSKFPCLPGGSGANCSDLLSPSPELFFLTEIFFLEILFPG